jgi:6-pyruvoyltetrahydropterin/6-carboxytetrahydropterin synthase
MESVSVSPAEPAPEPAAPGTPLVEVTRAYRFSAAHRLHSPRFSAAENARLYGRCNNPSGHGHTYRLQVTIRGAISPGLGWIADGQRLDDVVGREVVRRFDRTNLDAVIASADGPTSTTEVLAAVIWRILDGALPPGRLWRLRLEETPNNFFELDRQGVDRSSRPVRPMAADRGQKVSPA